MNVKNAGMDNCNEMNNAMMATTTAKMDVIAAVNEKHDYTLAHQYQTTMESSIVSLNTLVRVASQTVINVHNEVLY